VKIDDISELEGDINSTVYMCQQKIPTGSCRQRQHRREMSMAQAGEDGRPREVGDRSPKLLQNHQSLGASKFDCKSFAMNDS